MDKLYSLYQSYRFDRKEEEVEVGKGVVKDVPLGPVLVSEYCPSCGAVVVQKRRFLDCGHSPFCDKCMLRMLKNEFLMCAVCCVESECLGRRVDDFVINIDDKIIKEKVVSVEKEIVVVENHEEVIDEVENEIPEDFKAIEDPLLLLRPDYYIKFNVRQTSVIERVDEWAHDNDVVMDERVLLSDIDQYYIPFYILSFKSFILFTAASCHNYRKGNEWNEMMVEKEFIYREEIICGSKSVDLSLISKLVQEKCVFSYGNSILNDMSLKRFGDDELEHEIILPLEIDPETAWSLQLQKTRNELQKKCQNELESEYGENNVIDLKLRHVDFSEKKSTIVLFPIYRIHYYSCGERTEAVVSGFNGHVIGNRKDPGLYYYPHKAYRFIKTLLPNE